MYTQQLADESRIYMILYVDDVLIAGSNKGERKKIKQSFHDKFVMKELRQAQHILGMQIERNRTTKILRLSQSDYIRKVLRHSHMENVKPTSTPLLKLIKLSDRDSPSTEEEKKLMSKVCNGGDPTRSCISVGVVS